MSFLDTLLGRPLAAREESQQKIGVLTGLPTVGLDALGSAAYGPEAALTILMPLGALGLAAIGPITLVLLILLAILYFSYSQTIAAYPNGGGSYTVAKENLGLPFGLFSAASLMLDYTLNVAVGISTGVGALISAVPSLHHDTLPLCLGVLALITVVNLRGARESGTLFAVPTYVFVACLGAVIAFGILRTIQGHGHPHPAVAPPSLPPAVEASGLWLLLRAFASGCTAMTGVEAVSNGVTAFKQPRVKTAHTTLTAMVLILGALLAGIAFLCRAYGVGAMDQTRPDYQSVLSQLTFAVAGRGAFYYVTLGSVLVVLSLSANTSYTGFPRLCRLVAQDGYLPGTFAEYGRRLVYSVGIVFLTGLAGLLLVVFGGITDRLIPLFAVGAFGAFTSSQAGMVMHWRRILREPGKEGGRRASRRDRARARTALLVNALGAAVTTVALVVIVIAKFKAGAWITLLIIPALMAVFLGIKRHYLCVERQTHPAGALKLERLHPPVVIVPIVDWNKPARRALRFGISLSGDVIAVHILAIKDRPEDAPEDALRQEADEKSRDLRRQWAADVEEPARRAGIPPPKLEILPSPYRKLIEPLIEYVETVKDSHPDRQIAVIIPELVVRKWWELPLHGHTATGLKAALLFLGDPRVVAVNVPSYLDE
jgi:amino acid transporter